MKSWHRPLHLSRECFETNSGSFKKLCIKGKVVPKYASPDVGERCPVNILDIYLSKLPRKAFKCDLVYLTNSGSFKKQCIKGKVVPKYASPDVGERCPVNILDIYLSKLPRKAFECDLFYLRPLSQIPADSSSPWYVSVLVGRDSLQTQKHVQRSG